MNSSVAAAVQSFIEQEKLPADYADTVQTWFLPMAEQLLQKVAVSREPLIVGVSGCQGSGKSTLAGLLVILLRELMGLKSINLSLDDFYLTHAQRQQLAARVHPLLATRGVPGTHDIDLAVTTIEALKQPAPVAIPRFNKALDDREAESRWPRLHGPMDVIILEGWCLSIPEQDEAALQEALNELESGEDPQGHWRAYVNQALKNDYHRLYDLIDYLIMLKAPAFELVYQWRQQQEDKLADRHTDLNHTRVMSRSQLKRFIQHYERLTRHGLLTLPARADVVFELSEQQTILGRN
ncbi:MAG: hypothetical protein RQ899_07080 [Pseudomonadales bacterium]|nr:hypothetical protein [Pseudomonadales bacterium]